MLDSDLQLLENILMFEVCQNDYNEEMWRSVLDTVVCNVTKSKDVKELSMPMRLAVSTVIVGANRCDIFDLVHEWIMDWREIGGAFWIIQEELLRHYAICTVRSCIWTYHSKARVLQEAPRALADSLSFTQEEGATEEGKENVTFGRRNSRLVLVDEMKSLLNSMKDTYPMMDAVDEYAARYPLPRFCRWFVTWAQHVLRECQRSKVDLTRGVHPVDETSEHRSENDKRPQEAPGGDQEIDVYEIAKLSLKRNAGQRRQQDVCCFADSDEFEVICDNTTPPPRTTGHRTTPPFVSVSAPMEVNPGKYNLSERYHWGGEWVMGGHQPAEQRGSAGDTKYSSNHPSPLSTDPHPLTEPLQLVTTPPNDDVEVPKISFPTPTHSESGRCSEPSQNDSRGSVQSDDGRVGVLWSVELHKQIWRVFTPADFV